ncbi:TetR/AcrR family transcriptional regulator [Terasakiella sp. A23]|uniref:TetR/AcrR family transcriptional regulator n=1 Tax=Terasakiella sp. FCG-A23 TaxID=3080561 RepID=UPI0029530995|nr:TetR/AcrR family transcriptional regulator [Terasakiella sp. A23]MDV7341741.1 TetR/AcrR family transcriptional regulator [Terasakiella sp. A23]
MGRRSDHTREELFEMAMQEARLIVAEEGWRKLTARALAKRMGYSVGTLYNLFGNIDDLVLHLNASTLDSLHHEMKQVVLRGTPIDDMEALLDCYLCFLKANASLWAVLFEHSLPEGQDLPDWYMEKIAVVLGYVEQAISPLFSGGEEGKRKEAAATIWASLHGIGSLAGANKLDAVINSSFEEMSKAFIRTYIAGLKS